MKFRLPLYGFLAVCMAVLALAGPRSAAAQTDGLLRGWFTIVWGDSRDGAEAPPVYMLTEDGGQATVLLLDEAQAAAAGGFLALDRRRVSVRGAPVELGGRPGLRVQAIALEAPPTEAGAESAPAEVSGSQPFITIMCKFSNLAGVEPNPLPFFENMYGSAYPGLDHYWRESSYDTIDIVGSDAAGWYTLPHNHDYYMIGTSFDLNSAAVDCTGVADPTVNFAPFTGINMMFNADLDCCAWGGGQYLTLDGVTKVWPITWEPPWAYADIAVIGHEMGHAFGLPHSSGTYGATYDNEWDVMSDTWSNCLNSTDVTYGCLPQHTISYHKDSLGWIPPAQKFSAGPGTSTTITLERLALPLTADYLMAQIPIGGSGTHFYTVEARRQAGYDVKLPGEAVIIHDVDLTRLRPANVIDSDGNGDTGDPGAMWTVGETFLDAANGISVQVLSATASGFQVRIQTPTTVTFKSLGANDGWVLESGENSGAGGSKASAPSTFNVGDDAANKQFRGLLHFDTSSLPDTAIVFKATLKVKKQGQVGTNPFTTHGALRADIRKTFFGTAAALQVSDFQASASSGAVASFGVTPSSNWYSAFLSATGRSFVNRTGTTQLRLRFNLDDNNDLGADYVKFFSGDDFLVNRPQLTIQYYMP